MPKFAILTNSQPELSQSKKKVHLRGKALGMYV